MKKLAFLGVIAASACALAEVTSSNVVGYQHKSLTPNGKWNFVCGMFNPRIGQDIKIAPMTLGDIVPSAEWVPGDDKLKTLTRNAGIAATYTYADKNLCEEWKTEYGVTIEPGWYLSDDFDNTEIMDFTEYAKKSQSLPMTSGFTVQAGFAGVTLIMSGEVLSADQPVALQPNGAWNFTGNYSPVEIELGDITPSSEWVPGDDKLKMFSQNFGVAATYTYVDKSLSDEWAQEYDVTIPVGWYLTEDFDNTEIMDFTPYCKNNLKIAPGQAFAVQAGFSVTLTIPTALPTTTQD